MPSLWEVKHSESVSEKSLAQQAGICEAFARLLINRGITDAVEAERFLNPSSANLHSPFLFKDIEKACLLIKDAVRKNEDIFIWGDYDVDGVCSVALLVLGLKRAQAKVSYHIPRRIEDGYGMNSDCVRLAKENNAKLFITVDCGISSNDEIDALRREGIKVIITDHHRPSEKLPQADAVINPWREDSLYPFKELAGVGVAFKLLQAFFDEDSYLFNDFLDLVALGTVCDVVPLKGENRIFVKEGLRVINDASRCGIRALKEVSGLMGKDVLATHLAFILGPRINASGRIDSAIAALELLLTDSYEDALSLAAVLNKTNKNRQQVGNRILKEALLKIERTTNFKRDKVIVLSNEDWHPGVIGIVASRIAERFFRPAIVVSTGEEQSKGSGRSIPGFHLFEAVKKCAAHLLDYGGHKHAIGLTIDKNRLSDFSQAINEVASDMMNPDDLIRRIDVDLQVSLEEITFDLLRNCDKLEPFGMGNPQPLFCASGLRLNGAMRKLGKSGKAFWVTDGRTSFEALDFSGDVTRGFNFAENNKFDLLFYPYKNEWAGTTSINLKVKDIRPYIKP